MKNNLMLTCLMVCACSLSAFQVEASTPTKSSGTGIGGGQSSSQFLSWYNTSIATLRAFQRRAYNCDENFRANEILVDGLAEALVKSDPNDPSFTKKAIERGLNLAIYLDVKNPENDFRGHYANRVLLEKYYSFIFDVVAEGLDQSALFPYMRANDQNRLYREQSYEKSFIYYVLAQLEWLNLNLASMNMTDNIVVPFKNPSTYLMAAQLWTANVIEDLNHSLWSSLYSCSIHELAYLQKELQAYNLGNGGLYESDFHALNEVYYEIYRIMNQINSNKNCK